MLEKIISPYIFSLFTAGSLLVLTNTTHAQEISNDAIKVIFEASDNVQDQATIVDLWQKYPGKTIFIIDSYLESGLALLEQQGLEEKNKAKAMYNYGLHGALAADKAFNRKIYSDYASSFIGWNKKEQKQFRDGQKAYKRAMDALKNKKFEDALISANESINAAKPLGDWWGVAVALAAVGAAEEKLDNTQAALNAFSEARLIFKNFGMMKNLLRSETAMSRILVTLERVSRARVTINSATELASQLNDKKTQQELIKLNQQLLKSESKN